MICTSITLVARKEKLRFVWLVDTCQTPGIHVVGSDETQKVPVEWSSQRL